MQRTIPARSISVFLYLLLLVYPLLACGQAKSTKTEHIVLITLDGFRWEELFAGASDSLMADSRFVKDTVSLRQQFGAATPEARRLKLMPWLWSTLAQSGQLFGNRRLGNQVKVTNPHWFSYPGYSEMLTGFVEPAIGSNDKVPNPNVTVLEWLHKQAAFREKVAAFGSWDVFPYILNQKRSGIPVNAGFSPAGDQDKSAREAFLNQLQTQIPSPWPSVRLDAFTHHYALEYLQRKHPRVVYIAYGETDDFAHDGQYDQYLQSAHRTDGFIKQLWESMQADPVYRNKTTFLITTDHGRGNHAREAWKHHGKEYPGSDAIWLAVLGPDTPATGEVKTKGQWGQNQIAQTVAALLGLQYTNTKPVGAAIGEVFTTK
jgi:hypothetical protein